MQSPVKQEIFNVCCKEIANAIPDSTESQQRKAAEAMTVEVMRLWLDNSTELSNQLATISELYEKNRKNYRDHIEKVEAGARAMLDFLIKNGLAKVERDEKKRSTLICKSKLAAENVAFINILNDAVRHFYTVVYDAQTDNTIKQTSLF